MNDQFWAGIRYSLIGLGMFLAGTGVVAEQDVIPFVDNTLLPLIGALITGGTAAWGMYVIHRTRRVPDAVARQRNVKTINPMTGAVEPGSKYVAE